MFSLLNMKFTDIGHSQWYNIEKDMKGKPVMWEVIKEQKTTEDNVQYNAYGVRREDYSIPDICTDSEEISRFAELLNKFDVSPVNAIDIVEDYLAQL